MLVKEQGPLGVFKRLRELTGIQHDEEDDEPVSWGYSPLVCVLCTSVWVALGLVWIPRRVKEVLAVSGVASLVHIFSDRT